MFEKITLEHCFPNLTLVTPQPAVTALLVEQSKHACKQLASPETKFKKLWTTGFTEKKSGGISGHAGRILEETPGGIPGGIAAPEQKRISTA